MAKIAVIPTVCIVGGERKVIPVGAELPAEVPAHDVTALLASGVPIGDSSTPGFCLM
jgi:hypothetical protein